MLWKNPSRKHWVKERRNCVTEHTEIASVTIGHSHLCGTNCHIWDNWPRFVSFWVYHKTLIFEFVLRRQQLALIISCIPLHTKPCKKPEMPRASLIHSPVWETHKDSVHLGQSFLYLQHLCKPPSPACSAGWSLTLLFGHCFTWALPNEASFFPHPPSSWSRK